MKNSLNYTDEQIMIRAMPCPECFAKPREFCKRKPDKNGMIRNHHERQKLFHRHVSEVSFGHMYFETEYIPTTQRTFEELIEYDQSS